jgi:DNA repair exonuclease SbcCD nuclease subunit
MKILFSADWHIKLGQKNVPVNWAIARYNSFFEQIHSLEEDVDLHIIGGDIFDRVPTLDELELYFEFISKVSVETIIFDGNHEATKKNKTFFSSLVEVTQRLNPLVTIVDESYEDSRGFSILPYCDLHKKDSIEILNSNLPVFTHVRGEIPPHVTPEVDLERFARFPVVYAGDLHSHSNTQKNIVYPGSPMTTSFHRNRVSTGVIIALMEDNDWYWEELKLPQLIRKTVSSEDDMVQEFYDHVIYELEGDLGDLSKVSNSSLLDKKIVKRSTEAALVLGNNLSIGEELVEYLTYILEIPEEKIPGVIGIYNDYSKETTME